MGKIFISIKDARKEDMSGLKRPNDWAVLHPSNDSILAYCETEKDADDVIAAFNAIGDNSAKTPTFKDVKGFFMSWGMFPHEEDCNAESDEDNWLNPEVIEQGINHRCFEKMMDEAKRLYGDTFRQFCSRQIDAVDDGFYVDVDTWDTMKEAWENWR